MTQGAEPGVDDEPIAILETMRQLTQVTLRAGSREQLERDVCRTFVASDLYVFAWIGTEDPETGRVIPRASAGVEEGYLAAIDITVGTAETGGGPTGRAFATRELQVVQDLAEDPSYEPWREEALSRDYRSSAAVPLVYDETFLGVLNLYAPRPGAFDSYERTLLAELGSDVAYSIDVLETRAALEQNRDFLARTEELAGAGGWEFDPETGDVRWTAGARRVLDDAATGLPSLAEALESIHPPDRTAFETALERAVETSTPIDLTLRSAGDGEDHRWIRIIGQPVETAGGRPTVRGALQDVTEQKEYQDRLTIRNEQLLIINRIVRHDIRNDVTIVLGWGAELADHVDDEGAGMLDRILDTSDHVLDLTYALRDFVRSIETHEHPGPVAVNVGEILAEEVEKRRSGYPGATFELDGPIPDWWVLGDELLSSVFRNILDNAVVHNDKPEPHVEIAVERTNGAVCVRIADDGPGIQPDRREAVLGRTEAGLDHPEAGLGLYLVDSLVTSYGGELTIEDNEPTGTVFSVELPATDAPGEDPDGGVDGGR